MILEFQNWMTAIGIFLAGICALGAVVQSWMNSRAIKRTHDKVDEVARLTNGAQERIIDEVAEVKSTLKSHLENST